MNFGDVLTKLFGDPLASNAIAATSSVSRMAASASGSTMAAR